METLGFLEAPTRTWSSPPPESTPAPASNGHHEPSGLVSLPVGRHSRHAEPTGELVKDMWESTELNAPSLVDWAPQAVVTKHLGGRKFRWPTLILSTALLVVLVVGGVWLYRQPDSAAEAAVENVRSEAQALAEAIDSVSPLLADLDAERLPEANQDATAYFDLGERARRLFAASAELPTDDSNHRSSAADAASLAIEASRQLMDVTAYRTALEPVLTLPLLETNPDLTDLTTATEAFTEWRSTFDSVRTGLPADAAAETSLVLEELSGELEQVQSSYLEALSNDNRAAVVEIIGRLRADLASARQTLLTEMAAVGSSVAEMLDLSEQALDDLLG